MSVSGIIDPLTNKIYPQLITGNTSVAQTLGEVLSVGSSAKNPITNLAQDATDFKILGCEEIETSKVYQGNQPFLKIGEAGDTLMINGAITKGSILVGNDLDTGELLVGANGTYLKANSLASKGVEWSTIPIPPSTETLGNVMLNGAIASTNLDMNNFNIINANTITSANILSLLPVNAVEIGTPQRRQELVTIEVANTGSLSNQNPFNSTTGVIDGGGFSVPTNTTNITTINASSGYDDFNNGNSTIQISLIEDDGGVETTLGGQNLTTSSGLATYTITFSPAITINPSPTKTYFVRMSVPIGSPMYSYYGTTADGLTPAIIVIAQILQTVSDPVDYFNVYGNCFFQSNVLIHATQTIADPVNSLYSTIYDYNQIQLLAPTFDTAIGAGQIFVNNGVNRVRVQGSSITVERTDGVGTQSVLNNQTLTFYYPSIFQVGIFDSQQAYIYRTSGTIASARLQYGSLELNDNTNGSFINLRRDSTTPVSTVVSRISTFAKNTSGVTFEYSRIQTQTENNSTGNEDGTLQIYNLVNGTLQQTFTFNGAQNENNSFRPLDMNANDIRTTTGNLVLTANSSTGIGNATLQSKSGAQINLDTGLTGRINFVTTTTTATPNHNVNFQSTSNSVASASYLKCKLNGVDIWIPYLTTDPSL
jgi:hypothetical protein